MKKKKFIIGIDLGTTNCTVAYTKYANSNDSFAIEQFAIPQIVSKGVEGELFLLPSFLYFPLQEEHKAKDVQISWDPQRTICAGTFARDRGAEIPQRLVSSAKSWTCHPGIDRREKILPLQAESAEEKLSPVEAMAELLKHIREAWDLKNPQTPLKDQQVLITVPASFDPSARQLVQEAASLATYPEIILLEEPQAAFYSWLEAHHDSWRKELKVGDKILVVDIGGGTTDFSLIEVAEESGDLILHRKAVGAHLLLGGDNLDLALAYLAKQKLEDQGHAIDEWQLNALVHLSRNAKEQFLSKGAPDNVELVIQGRGSRLIGKALKTTLSREESLNILIEGFAPIVKPEERSQIEKSLGIQQIGLPYAKDPRISCQLAKFLSMTGEALEGSLDNFVLPTAVLFNGGTLKAEALKQRLMELLNHWAAQLHKGPVKELDRADLDFAVSRGACFYGLAREGKAIRIRGGTGRSYYVAIEDALPAVPGIPRPLKAICVVPFGMEEGTEQELAGQDFSLLLGELATFRFFSHGTPSLASGVEPSMGTVVKNWKQELTELHPIEALLPQEGSDSKSVKVKLVSKVTELGILELWCVAEDGRKWKLEFDIRHQEEACNL